MSKKKTKGGKKAKHMLKHPHKQPSKKNLLVAVAILLFAAIATYLLIRSFAASPSSPTANASCGARVQNYNYQVPFGKAIWNQPVCGLPKHPRSADYASRFYKWTTLNDGVSAGFNKNYGIVSSAPSFPEPTILDPEGLGNLYSRNVYFASEATTTTQVQSAVYNSNLDGEDLPYGDPRHNLPDARIPWNPAWRTGAAGDNEIVIIDESNGRIYGISGYKWDLAAVSQCGLLWRDRICAYHVDVARDPSGNYVDYRTYEAYVPNRGVGLSYYATLVMADEIKAGEIRHAVGVGIPNTAMGPVCTKAQLGTSAEGNSCGTAVAPASKFEWGSASTLKDRCGRTADVINNLYTQDKLIPEGMLFAVDIDDAGIEAWINSRSDLKSNARRAATARIFARALRDYGMMIVDTTCRGASIQTEGAVNPRAAAIFKEMGMGPEYPDNMLDGLITATNLYVVDPPTLRCEDATISKYYCKWTTASYASSQVPTDTTPPVVNITAPASNASVSGTVSVTATATDNSGTISKVELLVDNVVKQSKTSAPYSFSLDTTQLTAGAHTILVRAYDPSGLTGQKSITVTVSNPSQPVVTADFTADGKVNAPDLAILLQNYGNAVQRNKSGDCNGDGEVTVLDLSILLRLYTR